MITPAAKLPLTNFRATTKNGYEYEVVRPNVIFRIKSEPIAYKDTDVKWLFPISSLGVSKDEDVKNCLEDFATLIYNQSFILKFPLSNVQHMIEARLV